MDREAWRAAVHGVTKSPELNWRRSTCYIQAGFGGAGLIHSLLSFQSSDNFNFWSLQGKKKNRNIWLYFKNVKVRILYTPRNTEKEYTFPSVKEKRLWTGRNELLLPIWLLYDCGCFAAKLCLTLFFLIFFFFYVLLFCNPMNCSPPGFSVHWISQARILEWVAISFSKGSSQPRDGTHVSCTDRRIFYHWVTWEAPSLWYILFMSTRILAPFPTLCKIGIVPSFLQNCDHCICCNLHKHKGLPPWLSAKQSACQCRRQGVDPWDGKIPWRRAWQPTPVFLPGESHGQEHDALQSMGITKSQTRLRTLT